jgi:hypothetical protein
MSASCCHSTAISPCDLAEEDIEAIGTALEPGSIAAVLMQGGCQRLRYSVPGSRSGGGDPAVRV